MERFEFGGEIVWRPTPEYAKGCRLARSSSGLALRILRS